MYYTQIYGNNEFHLVCSASISLAFDLGKPQEKPNLTKPPLKRKFYFFPKLSCC